jgi:hypothetical protein
VPRWTNPFRRTPAEPDITKAISMSGAATFTSQQVAALLASSTVGGQTTGAIVPLPRTEPQVAFGPGVPLIPGAIDPLNPRTGRPEPRFNEYPVSSNLPGVNDRLVPWKVLRDAADVGGLARRCIEIRKAEIASLEWSVTITRGAVDAARAAQPDRAPSEVESELRERLTGDIARCTAFWERPDRGQDEDTGDWLSKLLEEHLVLDAIAIYPRRTLGGDLFALEILDGSTIKLLRDHRGGRPMPPNPAYQQVLQGFPRGEFIADQNEDGTIPDSYRSDELIYKRRNVRSHTPYGYSAVEQALEDIDVWLRRRKWIRDEYTEGTVPTGLLRNSGASGWSPAQTSEYETLLNDAYSTTGARHRLRVLPPGMELETQSDAAERYKPEYDLFLIKLIAAHFDVTIAELGFTEQGGLGSSGWHEGQADVQQRKATMPTLRWLQQLVTTISRQHLGMPTELEFRFLGLEEEGEAAADEVAKARVADGRMTYNEDRDRMGMPRYDFPEADMPMIRTSRGLVFLNGASELVPPGELVGAVQGHPLSDADADGILDAPQGPDTDTAGDTDTDTADAGDNTDDRDTQVKTEIAAYRRWARKNPDPRRPFRFAVVTKADAPDLPAGHVTYAGGDPAPKAERPAAWPGWDRDQSTAALWARRLARQAVDSTDADALAEAWLAEQLPADRPDTDGDEDDSWAVLAAHGFLNRRGVDLAQLLPVLRLIWAEGWALGWFSARSVRTGEPASWAWPEGDAEAALRSLPDDVRQDFDVWAQRAAAQAPHTGRMNALARLLAEAVTGHLTARQLSGAIRQLLSDQAWAAMTALTELVRAQSAAATVAYRQSGTALVQWTAEPDNVTCVRCLDLEAAGPVPIGSVWPDGTTAPPAHPRCRCYLTPA